MYIHIYSHTFIYIGHINQICERMTSEETKFIEARDAQIHEYMQARDRLRDALKLSRTQSASGEGNKEVNKAVQDVGGESEAEIEAT